jgi:signal transduction histidine kinase
MPSKCGNYFQNLIGNALKYHKEDVPPVVQVYTFSDKAGGCSVVVEDNGIGFEEL